jgi:superfamily II DNA or RNA helicase
MLDGNGGALLADEVGLGKTFVALALAPSAGRMLVVAPAALRERWLDAGRRSNVVVIFASYEALSRGRLPKGSFELLVLDEAHHARNPATRRYRALATLARSAPVLLLTATPIHNAAGDLRALLALFLGSAAAQLEGDALRAHVVRRGHRDLHSSAQLPTLHRPEWIRMRDDARVLQGILELPPPLPPRDGGDAGALLAMGLLRLWASSRAALGQSLSLRLARAIAMQHSLADGHYPDARTLARWASDAEVVQLAFPGILGGDKLPADDVTPLRQTLEAHAAGLRRLLALLADSPSPDRERARALTAIRTRHPQQRVVAFTQFAATARELYRMLREEAGVCALTARGAQVAGGPISRREALEAFAPKALGVPPPRAAERITLLIATDLLSEGIDLHDASVVVHLDLPWTVARLEQRVGRARRLGSAHAAVSVYAFAPPASTGDVLRAESRLQDKLLAAGRTLGAEHRLLPPELADAPAEEPLRATESVLQQLEQWNDMALTPDHPVVAAVRAEESGWLAAIETAGGRRLVGSVGDSPVTDHRSIERIVRNGGGEDVPVRAGELRASLRQLRGWAALDRGSASAAVGTATPVRLAALERIGSELLASPLHARVSRAVLAARARDALRGRLSFAAERELEALLAEGGELIERLSCWRPLTGSPAGPAISDVGSWRLLALLIMRASNAWNAR